MMTILAEATTNDGLFGPQFWGLVISALTTVLVGVLKIYQSQLEAKAAKPAPPEPAPPAPEPPA